MTWWPGWDSIENTGGWAHFWFWFGMVCFFLLGASEIIAFRYSLRKDDLVAVAEVAAAKQRKTDQDNADARHTTELGGLKGQLSEAEKKLSEIRQQQADRRLSEDQKRDILAAISPFPGQKVNLETVMNDGEAFQYARDFYSVFEAAKWDLSSGLVQSAFTGDIVGIHCIISETWRLAGKAPAGAGMLIKTLVQLGIIKEGLGEATVSGNDIRVIIGRKPTRH